MQIYHYNQNTGELTGQTNARPDPLEPGRWLIPKHATTIAPPTIGENEVAVFASGAWTLQPDYRTTPVWDTATAEPVQMDGIGPLPDGLTLIEPPDLFPVWTGDGWGGDVMAAAATKAAQLQAEFTTRMQEPLLYDGDTFLVDDWSIQTIKTTLDTCLYLGLRGDVPIPTRYPLQSGYWLALDEDGEARIPVPMTVARLRGLHIAGWERNADLWGSLMIHKAQIEARVAEGATAFQIMAYNHTDNWVREEQS